MLPNFKLLLTIDNGEILWKGVIVGLCGFMHGVHLLFPCQWLCLHAHDFILSVFQFLIVCLCVSMSPQHPATFSHFCTVISAAEDEPTLFLTTCKHCKSCYIYHCAGSAIFIWSPVIENRATLDHFIIIFLVLLIKKMHLADNKKNVV